MIGKMYIHESVFYGNPEYIVYAETGNLVALVNILDDEVLWVTKHKLKTDYKEKQTGATNHDNQ